MSDTPTDPSRPRSGRGQTFYYSDYSLGAGRKVYSNTRYPCCAGTYAQAVADYHDLIYFKDPSSLYVNLYVPSQVTWNHDGSNVKIEQDTTYPESQTTTLHIDPSVSTTFTLNFRVPLWSQGLSVEVNGAKQRIAAQPGTWASVDRRWNAGDVVKVTVPMSPRLVPVDSQHPDRVAVSVGPVVLVREMESKLVVADRDPLKWLQNSTGLEYRTAPPANRPFVPFYSVGRNDVYKMYFDLETPA
jgi:uncharacterized protein